MLSRPNLLIESQASSARRFLVIRNVEGCSLARNVEAAAKQFDSDVECHHVADSNRYILLAMLTAQEAVQLRFQPI